MRASAFTIETRGQGALVFGGQPSLQRHILKHLASSGIHTLVPKDLAEIDALRENLDLDFIVLFGDHDISSYLSLIRSLLSTGESRLILLTHESATDPVVDLPVSKHLVYSDYLGSDEYFSPLLASWFSSLKTSHKLVIPGDGVGEISILPESDLAALVVAHLLRPTKATGEIIYLGDPDGVSLLNLAYLIRSNLTHKVHLTFDQGVDPAPFDKERYLRSLDTVGYKLTGSIESDLKRYLKHHLQLAQQLVSPVLATQTPPREPAPPKIPEPNIKKLTPLVSKPGPVFVPLESRRPKLRFPLARPSRPRLPRLRPLNIVSKGLIIALALYLGTLAFTATIAALSLRHVMATLQSGSLPKPNQLNSFAVTYLEANYLALTSLTGLSSRPSISQTTALLDVYQQTLTIFKTANLLGATTGDLIHYIFGSGTADIAQTISRSRLETEELYQQLSLLDGSLPDAPPEVIPLKHHEKYTELKSELSKLKRSVITAKAVLATTPDIIGLGGRRKYAVLFQNNMELRATGGFIGSFAILSFENGKLYDMPIYDVYDADGQLKGFVEPPAPIKDILGEASWYLRDSNFDPDFPTSARRAEWFIKKSLNQELDGTIAVNVNTLVGLLESTGPLVIPDYDETITAGNLYERAQYHAEVNFFPGSTQKKEFLSTVASTLFATLPSRGVGDSLGMVRALTTSVEQKNTLFSFLNPATDQVFETLGWNGELHDFPCPSLENCHKDYLMVVDSNFGVNKANFYLKRSIEQIITFDKDLKVTQTTRILYQNTSTSTSWPAGAYKNYSRIYLPVGVNISGVKVGGVELLSSNYQISVEHGKTVVAYLVTVPINSSQVVEVSYTSPQLPQEDDLLYTWYWQKQPGTSVADPLTVYLNYPLYLRPSIISPSAELPPQQLKFNMANDTDRRVTVKFSR